MVRLGCLAPRRAGLFTLSVLFALAMSHLADKAIPLLVQIPPEAYGFAPPFPPNAVQHTQCRDFDSVARINSLGFRGREIAIDKGKTYRIVVIGASYVFGWGLNEQECWVRILEERLRQSGLNVEILNLGMNGAAPYNYVYLARDAAPLLKPNLVLLALGHGNDLQWAGEMPIGYSVSGWLKWLCPNLIAWRSGPRRHVPQVEPVVPDLGPSHREVVAQYARSIFDGFDAAQRQRFEALEQQVKDAFLNGEVNPGLFSTSICEPEFYAETLDTEAPRMRERVQSLGSLLKELKRITSRSGAKLLVTTIPYGVFVNNVTCRNYARIGFHTSERMPVESDPDAGFRTACAAAGLGLIVPTAHFRKEIDNPRLYFELDLHMAPEGERLLADFLFPYVSDAVKAGSTP